MRRALLSAAVVVVLDQLTKIWAVARLVDEPGQRIALGFGAEFQLHYNKGAAFSSGTSFGQIIAVVAFGMSILLFRLASQRQDRYGQIVLGSIAGGAVGNLLDRIFRAEEGPLSGAVVDFIRPFDFFAIFNVADAAIVVGVIAVLVQAVLFPPDEPETKPTASNDSEVTSVASSLTDDEVGQDEDLQEPDKSLPSV